MFILVIKLAFKIRTALNTKTNPIFEYYIKLVKNIILGNKINKSKNNLKNYPEMNILLGKIKEDFTLDDDCINKLIDILYLIQYDYYQIINTEHFTKKVNDKLDERCIKLASLIYYLEFKSK
jgi:hypothetical protein